MTAAVLCSLACLALLIAANLLQGGCRMTPDGVRYYRVGRGEPVPLPFRTRWLLPRLFELLSKRMPAYRLSWSDGLWRTPPEPAGRIWLVALFLASLGTAFTCGLALSALGLNPRLAVCAYLTAACLRSGLPYVAVRPVLLDSIGHLAAMLGVLALLRGDLPLLMLASGIGLLSREMVVAPLALLGSLRIGWTALAGIGVCVLLYLLLNRGRGSHGIALTLSKVRQYALLHRSRWWNPEDLCWHWLPLLILAAVGSWQRPDLLALPLAFLLLGLLQASLGSDWSRLWYAAWPGLVVPAAGCPPVLLAVCALASLAWPALTLWLRPKVAGRRVLEDGGVC